MRFQIRHTFSCSPTRFWEIFFDARFNERLWADAMRAPKYELSNDTVDASGDRQRRFQVVLPQLELPKAIAALINPEFGYTEQGTFSAKRNEYTFNQVLTVLSDKITLKGTIRLDPRGPEETVRIGDLEVGVRLPLIGGLGERAAESNLRKAWDEAARFTTAWIKG